MMGEDRVRTDEVRWDGHDRRHDAISIAAIEKRLAEGKARMDAFEKQLVQNTKLTSEIHEWVGKGRGFFYVLGLIGSMVKWLAAVAAAIVLLWKLWWMKDDGTPPPPM
ncbi:hypothetical protein UFOVP435_28 [uncultured Caudovirales phage]|uniref:Uncharacterized protein n=1 Tax=uncultured Caudovirales phage TaxID=2100421 RepID=A0A6J5M724_9CAUD|nr:hypothetical protein UFOVP435_28 [uncultured Caudovirales phage]